jgi:hypothetical protein
LGLTSRPSDLGKLQAVAAVGQRRLMDVWADAFESHKLPVAQLLLTREDIDDRTRFLNVRNTINAAHELGAVPINNENDTISTSELIKITFGDNDILAALVASALRADLLVLLSVVDVFAREQQLRERQLVRFERVGPDVHQAPLANGGDGLQLAEIARPRSKAQFTDARADGARAHDRHAHAAPAQRRNLFRDPRDELAVELRRRVVQQLSAELNDDAANG